MFDQGFGLKVRLSFAILAFASCVTRGHVTRGQTSEPIWIPALAWRGNSEIVAAQSQGLLLRPAHIVKTEFQHLDALTSFAEIESSLWTLLPIDDSVLTTDYKGSVWRVNKSGLQSFDFKTRWFRSLALVPGSSAEVLAGSEDGQLVVFDAQSGAEVRRSKLESVSIFATSFHPQRTQVAVACGDGSVHLLSWPELQPIKILKSNGAVWDVQFSEDGTRLLTGGVDRRLRLWDLESGQSIVAIASASDWITSLVVLPQSSLVVAGTMSGEIILADYQSKLPVKTVKVAQSGIWDVALSADAQRLAVGTRKDSVKVLEISGWYAEGVSAAKLAEVERPPQP